MDYKIEKQQRDMSNGQPAAKKEVGDKRKHGEAAPQKASDSNSMTSYSDEEQNGNKRQKQASDDSSDL